MQRLGISDPNPSIGQLFPPKTPVVGMHTNTTSAAQHADAMHIDNQSCTIFVNPTEGNSNYRPLMLLKVPPENLPRTNSSAIKYQSLPLLSSSSANHVNGESITETFPSPRTPSSSSPSFSDGTPRNLNMYVPLYRAALKGDWEQAKCFIHLHSGAEHARITMGWETALHIAAGAKHTLFVEEIVKLMSGDDLALQNKDDNTALCFAAASGIIRIAEVMVNRNKKLPGIRGSMGVTPLYMAALLGHKDMVWYLLPLTEEYLKLEDYFGILIATITTDLFDVSLHIIHQYPDLAMYHGRNGETALQVLARKPLAFASGMQLGSWGRCIYPWIRVELPRSFRNMTAVKTPDDHSLTRLLWGAMKLIVPGVKDVYEKKLSSIQAVELVKCLWEEIKSKVESQFGDLLKSPSGPLFTATKFGIVDFVAALLYSYPDLIWKADSQKRTLFHIAVLHRREKIFSLIYGIGAHKDLITSYTDDNNHNMLHLAGKLAPLHSRNNVSGAALQMQRELLWFKEVEKIVQPLYKDMRDREGRTPRMIFTEEHQDLLNKGEKWMKNTASSCMLVATLITTVMFAAIFTVPGGVTNDKGTPIYLEAKAFVVFAMSDAFALFSSVTSIFMFLSILTSRYAEEDFLKSLPQRLSIGIAALFLSIVNMLVAFSATFFLVLGHQWAWIVIPLSLVACLLVSVFAFLHFPLLVDTIHSTYGSGIFPRKQKIYD